MIKFLIDEDLPRSTARVLREQGFKVLDVRDCGLRGQSDDQVFTFAQKEQAILVTADLGFGNFLHYPPGSHAGILIIHFPNEVSTEELNRRILDGIANLSEKELIKNLVVLEPGRVRVRKA